MHTKIWVKKLVCSDTVLKASGITKMRETQFLPLSCLSLRILQISIPKYMIETKEVSENRLMTR